MAENASFQQLKVDLVLLKSYFLRFNIDLYLLVLLGAIAIYGLAMLSHVLGQDLAMFGSQVLRILLAFACMLLVAQIPPVIIQRWTPWAYAGCVGLLIVTLFYGDEAKGSRRWIEFPYLPRFQPSELLKLAIPLMLAWYLRMAPSQLRLRDIAVAFLIIALPVSFVYLQPDLGTTALVTLGSSSIVFVAGIRIKWVVSGALVGMTGLLIAWDLVLTDYQVDRIKTFLNPEADPLGNGWNIIQSKIALGSGGLFGKGFGEGTQSQLNFLPEGHTDFILAVIGEEMGFVGCAVLLMLYFAVFARGLLLCKSATTRFAQCTITGLIVMFFLYVLINVMMVCGLLPVVGAPLPLVSFGGTSAITFLVGFGLMMALRDKPTQSRVN